MDADANHTPSWRQRALRVAIAGAGIGSILGSVAGIPSFDLCFSPECGWNPLPLPPYTYFERSSVTVQLGNSVTFKVSTPNATPGHYPAYEWCRTPSGGSSCAPLAGASGPTYTVNNANLADDGARYTVTATNAGGSVQATALLAVSTGPAVVHEDGEFVESEWVVAQVGALPGGSTFTASRSPTGGNPGAFRAVSYLLRGEASNTVRVAHLSVAATYDPASHGAIYTIDFTEDCAPVAGFSGFTTPLILQAGRIFAATSFERWCQRSTWSSVSPRSSLGAADFVQIDGPACGAGETCPDFSPLGAPLSLGLLVSATLASSLPEGTSALEYEHGFDNWKVSVWRR